MPKTAQKESEPLIALRKGRFIKVIPAIVAGNQFYAFSKMMIAKKMNTLIMHYQTAK